MDKTVDVISVYTEAPMYGLLLGNYLVHIYKDAVDDTWKLVNMGPTDCTLLSGKDLEDMVPTWEWQTHDPMNLVYKYHDATPSIYGTRKLPAGTLNTCLGTLGSARPVVIITSYVNGVIRKEYHPAIMPKLLPKLGLVGTTRVGKGKKKVVQEFSSSFTSDSGDKLQVGTSYYCDYIEGGAKVYECIAKIYEGEYLLLELDKEELASRLLGRVKNYQEVSDG